MHQKHLLRFIKSKLKKEPDEVVIFRWGLASWRWGTAAAVCGHGARLQRCAGS